MCLEVTGPSKTRDSIFATRDLAHPSIQALAHFENTLEHPWIRESWRIHWRILVLIMWNGLKWWFQDVSTVVPELWTVKAADALPLLTGAGQVGEQQNAPWGSGDIGNSILVPLGCSRPLRCPYLFPSFCFATVLTILLKLSFGSVSKWRTPFHATV